MHSNVAVFGYTGNCDDVARSLKLVSTAMERESYRQEQRRKADMFGLLTVGLSPTAVFGASHLLPALKSQQSALLVAASDGGCPIL